VEKDQEMTSTIRSLWLAISIGLCALASSAGACTTSLAHLASVLPDYPDPELRQLRQQILATDLNDALETAHGQGFSSSGAAQAALQQAEEYDRGRPQAEACIRQSAASDPGGIIRSLDDGSYDFNAGGIPSDCAKAYAAWKMGAIATREAAVGMACLAN
jgi:hypothetical protein